MPTCTALLFPLAQQSSLAQSLPSFPLSLFPSPSWTDARLVDWSVKIICFGNDCNYWVHCLTACTCAKCSPQQVPLLTIRRNDITEDKCGTARRRPKGKAASRDWTICVGWLLLYCTFTHHLQTAICLCLCWTFSSLQSLHHFSALPSLVRPSTFPPFDLQIL